MAKLSFNDISAVFDAEKLNEVRNRTSTMSSDIKQMVDDIVYEYCSELDSYLKQFDDRLKNRHDEPLSDDELETIVLTLTSLIYFTSSAQENLGIMEDISKAIRKDVYNKIRNASDGTVADKDSIAELKSQTETLVAIVYSRAYKKVKLKVEMAVEMINSIKKIISRRMIELELSKKKVGE